MGRVKVPIVLCKKIFERRKIYDLVFLLEEYSFMKYIPS